MCQKESGRTTTLLEPHLAVACQGGGPWSMRVASGRCRCAQDDGSIMAYDSASKGRLMTTCHSLPPACTKHPVFSICKSQPAIGCIRSHRVYENLQAVPHLSPRRAEPFSGSPPHLASDAAQHCTRRGLQWVWAVPTRTGPARLRRNSGSSVRMTPASTVLPAACSASRGISVNGGTTSLHTVTSDTACALNWLD